MSRCPAQKRRRQRCWADHVEKHNTKSIVLVCPLVRLLIFCNARLLNLHAMPKIAPLRTDQQAIAQPYHPLRRLSNAGQGALGTLDVTTAATLAASHPDGSDPAAAKAAGIAADRRRQRRMSAPGLVPIPDAKARRAQLAARIMARGDAGDDSGGGGGGGGGGSGGRAAGDDGAGGHDGRGGAALAAITAGNRRVSLAQVNSAVTTTLAQNSLDEFVVRRNSVASYRDVVPTHGPDGRELGPGGYSPEKQRKAAAAAAAKAGETTYAARGRRASIGASMAETEAQARAGQGGGADAHGVALEGLMGGAQTRDARTLSALWAGPTAALEALLLRSLGRYFSASLGHGLDDGSAAAGGGSDDDDDDAEAAKADAAHAHDCERLRAHDAHALSSRAAEALREQGSAALDAFSRAFFAPTTGAALPPGQAPISTARQAIELYRAAFAARDYPALPLLHTSAAHAPAKGTAAAVAHASVVALSSAGALGGERLTAAALVLLSRAARPGGAAGGAFLREVYDFLDGEERQGHRRVCAAFCVALTWDEAPTAVCFGRRSALRADGALGDLAAVAALACPSVFRSLRFIKLGDATNAKAFGRLAAALRSGACPALVGLELCFHVDCGVDEWSTWALTLQAATADPAVAGAVATAGLASGGAGSAAPLRHLVQLRLAGCYGGVDGIGHFALALKPRQPEGNTPAAAAARPVPPLRALKRLDLSRNGAGAQGLGRFAIALKGGALPALESLSVARNASSSDDAGGGVLALARTLRSRGEAAAAALLHLDISGNRAGFEAFEALAAAYAAGAMPNLRALEAGQNDAGDPGAAELADAIEKVAAAAGHGRRKSSKLQELGLGTNGIGDEGGRALLLALRAACPGMRRLDLSVNQLGPPSFNALALAMAGGGGAGGGGAGAAEKIAQLAHLDVSSNRGGEKGIGALVRALVGGGGTELVSLRVAANGCGAPGISAIARAIQGADGDVGSCPLLRLVDLSRNLPPALSRGENAMAYFSANFLRDVTVLFGGPEQSAHDIMAARS